MLSLPNVTLLLYDMAAPDLAALALRDCMNAAEFGDVQVWSDVPERFAVIPKVKAFADLSGSGKQAGQAVLWEQIPVHIETSHVLNIEWDAWIRDPTMWDDRFLEYDFIGAPWPWHAQGQDVGNGGFSLISSRLLATLATRREDYPYRFAWDDTLCRLHRPMLEAEGFRWAPTEVAARFSLEHGELRPSFGFHDCRNFPRVLDRPALSARIIAANDYVWQKAEWQEMMRGLEGTACLIPQ